LFACSCGNAAELVMDSEMRDIVKREINIIASNRTTANCFNG
jgi:type 1 glutamine amidotransferase